MVRGYGRRERVSAQMQKELSFVLQHDINDSRLGFITINEVVVSKDLAVAKIYITVLNADEQNKRENINVLNALVPNIRHRVAQRMRLRHIADFRFYYDHSCDTGMRIAQLLQQEK